MQLTLQSSNGTDRRFQVQLIGNGWNQVRQPRVHTVLSQRTHRGTRENEPAELCAGSNRAVTNHQSLPIARRAIHQLISTGGITK
jgi:hypothetical protein